MLEGSKCIERVQTLIYGRLSGNDRSWNSPASGARRVDSGDPGSGPTDPTDLPDAAGALLEPLLPTRQGPGRPRRVGLRRVLNAVFSDAHQVPVAAVAARGPSGGDRAVLLQYVDFDSGAQVRGDHTSGITRVLCCISLALSSPRRGGAGGGVPNLPYARRSSSAG